MTIYVTHRLTVESKLRFDSTWMSTQKNALFVWLFIGFFVCVIEKNMHLSFVKKNNNINNIVWPDFYAFALFSGKINPLTISVTSVCIGISTEEGNGGGGGGGGITFSVGGIWIVSGAGANMYNDVEESMFWTKPSLWTMGAQLMISVGCITEILFWIGIWT